LRRALDDNVRDDLHRRRSGDRHMTSEMGITAALHILRAPTIKDAGNRAAPFIEGQAWVRLQDLNDVSAVADRWRLRKGKRRRNLSTTARFLARRSSALGERVVESAVGACRGEHGGLIGVECGVWTVSRSAGDPLSFSIR
jgi:hypothetical protein